MTIKAMKERKKAEKKGPKSRITIFARPAVDQRSEAMIIAISALVWVDIPSV